MSWSGILRRVGIVWPAAAGTLQVYDADGNIVNLAGGLANSVEATHRHRKTVLKGVAGVGGVTYGYCVRPTSMTPADEELDTPTLGIPTPTLILAAPGTGTQCVGIARGAAIEGADAYISSGYCIAEPIADCPRGGEHLKVGRGGKVQLWNRGGVILATKTGAAFTNQPANDGVEIVSSSTADTTQKITLIGLIHGALTVVVTEELTLTGQTQVVSAHADWSQILAVKLDGACAGTVTVREASGNATITTLTAGQLSKGVETLDMMASGTASVTATDYLQAVTAAAATGYVGVMYTSTAGTTAQYMVAATLNGATPVSFTAVAESIQEIYTGAVSAAEFSVTTYATAESFALVIGKAVCGVPSEGDNFTVNIF